MITTIIPTFQRPHLLKKAILSVLNQSYPHFQVCVYDNASGDETEEIVRDLMEKDSRVKYYCHSENIGMMANYQFALSRVNTPFFSLLSDDDFISPTFFETVLQGFERFPDVAFSACGVQVIDENGQLLAAPLDVWSKEGHFGIREGLSEMITHPIWPIGIVFNSRIVKSVDVDYSEEVQVRWDTDYLLQLISRFPFVINKKICAHFLYHSQGFSSTFYSELWKSNKKLNGHLIATERMEQRLISSLEHFPKEQRIARKAFNVHYAQFFSTQVNDCIKLKIFNDASFLLSHFRKRVGFNKNFLKFTMKIWIFKHAKWAVPIIQWFLRFARKLNKKLLKRVLFLGHGA